MRIIDADALKRYIPTRMDMQDLYLPVHFITLIDEQPTVDAVPVRHGYNKQIEYPSQFTCSVCGWESWDTYCGDTDTFNYCPYCGAKMDGANGERKEQDE